MAGITSSRLLSLTLAAAVLAWLAAIEPAAAADRRALVIGNNAYAGLDQLSNARHDAAAIADHLATIGFDVVTVLDGGSRPDEAGDR